MNKFGTSQSVRRTEDLRFLTGNGRYMDDIAPERALHGYVFRSPVAHAEISALDVSAAETAEGVALVLTADRLEAQDVTLALPASVVVNRDGSAGAAPVHPLLAKGRVRFVGEAVAMIFAETLQQAKDAAELIHFDFDEIDAHVETAAGGEELHAEAPNNLAFDWAFGDEAATDEIIAGAAHVVRLAMEDNRIIVNSMEPRGCYAEMEEGRLHVCVGHQNAWVSKEKLANLLGMDEDAVRVSIPDVGGGFGMKGMDYPEMFVTAQAARMLGRPTRWLSERTEAMLSDNAGRDLTSHATMAFDDDGRLLAYRVDTIANMGAYNSQVAQMVQTELALKVLTGAYDVRHVFFNVKGVFTNTTPVDAYRGAGRPEAIYVLERAMDHAARVLGIDPWELRRRNFISAASFPYLSATGETYDVGDFHKVLTRAAAEADLEGFAARKAEAVKAGKLRGLGLCFYIEAILGDPFENAAVEFTEEGGAVLYVGTVSNGQGHETAYKQILHTFSGIPADAITIVQGDTDRIAQGGGTGGSRSVTTQGTATRAMVNTLIERYRPFLAEEWNADVAFDDGAFHGVGTNQSASVLEAAELARRKGREDLLRIEERATLSGRSYPNGAHVCEVEIDPETGVVDVVKYTVVDDFGILMNPMLVEGQVHGGVAQGIGQAIVERVVYDRTGQLLTATFMDYALPRADDLPMIGFSTEPVPSTANPLGMKGCGEAGTVGSLAAVANAVQDAVWDRGIRRVDMPFTPDRMWSMLHEGKDATE
ncbi:MAG: xanthine dehydrogenase family protein molybdopterin-binding subunit [Pseudomonadota bacterium]